MYGSYVADVDSLNDPDWPPATPATASSPSASPSNHDADRSRG